MFYHRARCAVQALGLHSLFKVQGVQCTPVLLVFPSCKGTCCGLFSFPCFCCTHCSILRSACQVLFSSFFWFFFDGFSRRAFFKYTRILSPKKSFVNTKIWKIENCFSGACLPVLSMRTYARAWYIIYIFCFNTLAKWSFPDSGSGGRCLWDGNFWKWSGQVCLEI